MENTVKAKKITRQDVNLNIVEITLLSADEFENTKENIPDRMHFSSWWLRTQCPADVNRAGVVSCYTGDLDYYYMQGNDIGVRPALRIKNLNSANLKAGDKFELSGHEWTVISNELALCDSIVGHTCFRKSWNRQDVSFKKRAEDTNTYEVSGIKIWLENWAADHGIIVREVPVTA